MQLLLNWLYLFFNFFLASLHIGLPPGLASTVVSLVTYAVYANYYVDIKAFLTVALYCVSVHLLLMVLSAALQLL